MVYIYYCMTPLTLIYLNDFKAKQEQNIEQLREENECLKEELDTVHIALHNRVSRDRVSRCTSVDDRISSSISGKISQDTLTK